MKHKVIAKILLTALCLLGSVAWASTTWYVNGVSGSDSNACTSPTTACKTIGHAISLAASGDLIKVAAATYTENLTIGFSLTLVGSGAPTTIIDGGGINRVVTISSATAHVTLSKVTIRNGHAFTGAGIFNSGTLRVIASTVSGNTVSLISCNLCSANGGGINNFTGGTLTISRSTLSGNLAEVTCFTVTCAAGGGGIFNQGRLTINNSTISGNSAEALIPIPPARFKAPAAASSTLPPSPSTTAPSAGMMQVPVRGASSMSVRQHSRTALSRTVGTAVALLPRMVTI